MHLISSLIPSLSSPWCWLIFGPTTTHYEFFPFFLGFYPWPKVQPIYLVNWGFNTARTSMNITFWYSRSLTPFEYTCKRTVSGTCWQQNVEDCVPHWSRTHLPTTLIDPTSIIWLPIVLVQSLALLFVGLLFFLQDGRMDGWFTVQNRTPRDLGALGTVEILDPLGTRDDLLPSNKSRIIFGPFGHFFSERWSLTWQGYTSTYPR